MDQKLDLLQGTLDLLILRTLIGGAAHGLAIAKYIQRTSEELLQVETGSPIQPCIGWRRRDGSRRAGPCRIRASVLGTTG
jgi:hypothetical protein